MMRLPLWLMIVVNTGALMTSAAADDRLAFYHMLLSEERNALEAISGQKIDELLTIHNNAMAFATSERSALLKPGPFCGPAYIQLSVAVLGYASAIDPTTSRPARTPEEHASMGDTWWAEYRDLKADCENAIGVTRDLNGVARPSELLRRLLPALPNRN